MFYPDNLVKKIQPVQILHASSENTPFRSSFLNHVCMEFW